MRAHASRAGLLEGWRLTGPPLKQGTSLHEWLQGTSLVTPFPDSTIAPRLRIEHSYANDALLELALFPKGKTTVQPGVFTIGLHRYGTGSHARWLVDSWTPRGSSSMPAAPGSGPLGIPDVRPLPFFHGCPPTAGAARAAGDRAGRGRPRRDGMRGWGQGGGPADGTARAAASGQARGHASSGHRGDQHRARPGVRERSRVPADRVRDVRDAPDLRRRAGRGRSHADTRACARAALGREGRAQLHVRAQGARALRERRGRDAGRHEGDVRAPHGPAPALAGRGALRRPQGSRGVPRGTRAGHLGNHDVGRRRDVPPQHERPLAARARRIGLRLPAAGGHAASPDRRTRLAR